MTAVEFSPAQATRTFDDVVRQLRERIGNGDLVVGDRLPAERLLALQFRVSRTMVREALRVLESAGIIELRKGAAGGAFIRPGRAEVVGQTLTDMLQLSGFTLDQLTDARVTLAAAITRVACERATEADLDRLVRNMDAAAALARAGDWDQVALAHLQFHELLAEATGNPVLAMIQRSILSAIPDITRRLGIDPHAVEGDNAAFVRARARFLRALRARDAERAVREMEQQLRGVHRYWIRRERETRAATTMP